MENARDMMEGGARCNSGSVSPIGIGTLADHPVPVFLRFIDADGGDLQINYLDPAMLLDVQ